MILHITFTDGSNPWVSFSTDYKTLAKMWRNWAKNPNARPIFMGDGLECRMNCIHRWCVSKYFDGAHRCKEFKYLANALKYIWRVQKLNKTVLLRKEK